MLLILSPSKTLDYETPFALKDHTQPQFLKDSELLVKKLRTLSQKQIGEMMEISEKLSALNVQRFKDFKTPFTLKNARQALLAFKGDVYEPMEVESYGQKEFLFAQEHVRILSGLYGLLRPLDLIQPYRLEMGRKLTVGKSKDLYGFWGTRIAEALNGELAKQSNKLLINLASEEYGKVVLRKALQYPVLDIAFKENKGGKIAIIALFAKQARGLITDYIIKNHIDKPDQLKDFSERGYKFESKLSTENQLVFVRKAS